MDHTALLSNQASVPATLLRPQTQSTAAEFTSVTAEPSERSSPRPAEDRWLVPPHPAGSVAPHDQNAGKPATLAALAVDTVIFVGGDAR